MDDSSAGVIIYYWTYLVSIERICMRDAGDPVDVTGYSVLPNVVTPDLHHQELIEEDNHPCQQGHPQLTKHSQHYKHLKQNGSQCLTDHVQHNGV